MAAPPFQSYTPIIPHRRPEKKLAIFAEGMKSFSDYGKMTA
jgi:hypothetical protein